jgi:hypothetical protein
MRIGFVAGRLDRAGSKLFITPGGAPRGFPGPWRLAAVIRISEDQEPDDAGSGGQMQLDLDGCPPDSNRLGS